MANMCQNATYVTVQKILQDQIEDSYSHNSDLVSLKGRSNYPCTFYKLFGKNSIKMSQHELRKRLNEPQDCSKGYCRIYEGKTKCDKCVTQLSCPYLEKIKEAKESHTVVLNFHNLLRHLEMFKRDLLILDECHSLEKELLNHISLTIHDGMLSKYNIAIPYLDTPEEYAEFFAENNVTDKLTILAQMAENDKEFNLADDLTDQCEKLKRFLKALSGEQNDLWVSEYADKGNRRSVTIKPIYVNKFAHSLLFNKFDKVLFMSATILDPRIYLSSLGIQANEAKTYLMRNRFPEENRPIVMRPVAKMVGGKAAAEEWMPKIVTVVDDILKEHQNERGIIHTHNFMIAKYIMENCKQQHRLMFQENFQNKNEMLEMHASRKGSVLVAPALHEGLDLKDDLSRFQIICKNPWPNYHEDKQLEKRVKDPICGNQYYKWLTALKLIQSAGRSVRSETDWAVTYIIDEGIERFLQHNLIIPTWFQDAIMSYSTWKKNRKEWYENK